jgi:hypothetical protein
VIPDLVPRLCLRAALRSAAPAAAMAVFAVLQVACAGEKAKTQVAEQPPPETVYVRQPEPAPPPPEPLAVSPRKVAFDAIGDTLRLALPEGSTCVAASETVAHVDEQGLVRAVGNGDTHLRCWQGEHNASIRVTVTQQLARVAVVADEGLALRKSGDSLHFNLARVDRLGTPVEAVRTTWASLSPEVVRVDSATGLAVGMADSGMARIVGRADQLADTVIVEIGVKSQATQLLSSNSRSALSRSRALARANAQRVSARLPNASGAGGVATQAVTSAGGAPAQTPGPGIGARPAQGPDSLFHDPQSGGFGARQRFLVPTLMAGFAEHRAMTPQPGGLEKRSGAVFGGAFDITTRGMLSFRFQFLTGTLAKDTVTALGDIKLTDGSLDAGIAIAPWLTALVGVQARRYEETTTQRWVMVRAGGEADFSLGGGSLYGIARLLVIPLISVASDAVGVPKPSFGLTSALGLGFENRRISTSLVYDIERYSFSASQRKEQFGALLFRFGYKFGW